MIIRFVLFNEYFHQVTLSLSAFLSLKSICFFLLLKKKTLIFKSNSYVLRLLIQIQQLVLSLKIDLCCKDRDYGSMGAQ